MTPKNRLLILLIVFLVGLIPAASVAKSLPQAMAMSALLPGAGEIYSGHANRGIILTTADVVLLYSAWRCGREAGWLEDSYKQYALANAGISSGQSNDYYDMLRDWFSSSEYNAEVEQYFRNKGLAEYNNPDYYAAQIALYSVPDEDAWQWSGSATWKKYKSIRRDKQQQLINQKLAIGAAIANRVISVLDAVFLTKQYNKKQKASLSLTPDFSKNGAYLTCSWEF
jgi:hypothetical protein